MNGVGAFATGITTLVVLVTKFVEGAWITALLIPLMIFCMLLVHRHYRRVSNEIATNKPIDIHGLSRPRVIVPVDRWSRISEKALRFALTISDDVQAVHVRVEGSDEHITTICEEWEHMVAAPLRAAKMHVPELVTLQSPFRFILLPLVDHILEQERNCPDGHIAILVPEVVVRHWWENLLHNQRANMLKVLLLLRGNQRIYVVNVPWYL